MFGSTIKKFVRQRRAVVAVALAMMSVPLIIGVSAAVDSARVASARTLLQAAVDGAAIAGAGEWQLSESAGNASNVTTAAYNGTGAQLRNFVVAGTPTVELTCTGTSTQCGSGTAYATSISTYGCPAATEYCVIVSETVTLKNSLFAAIIPSELLTARSVATTAFPPEKISQVNFTGTHVGNGSDLSGIYAYAVPEDGSGNPQYGTVPAPNTNCEGGSANGPLGDQPASGSSSPYVTPASGSTGCNFLLVGVSQGSMPTGGSLSFATSDPISFTFVSFNGGNPSNSSNDLDTTSYSTSTQASVANAAATKATSVAQCVSQAANNVCTPYEAELYVDGTYHAAGYAVCSTGATGCMITAGVCSPMTTGCTAQPLYGYCPAHNLYGSIDSFPTSASNIVPTNDSISIYSSVYEMLGYPPTYATNHVLQPFVGPLLYFTNTGVVKSTVQTNGHTVATVCPQWPLGGTNIGTATYLTGTASVTPYAAPSLGITPVAANINTYATYYPGGTTSDGNSADVFPPPLAACTPVTSSTATPNATTTNPWWGWSPDNAATADPNGWWSNYKFPTAADQQNCTSVKVIAGGALSATSYPATGSSASAPFTSAYNNCAFLIQPLGTDTTTLPDYWTYNAEPGAFAALVTGNPEDIINSGGSGLPPLLDAAQNISSTVAESMTPVVGTAPSATSNPSIAPAGSGIYTVTEPPAELSSTQIDGPPADTSHHCYNPQANGYKSTTFAGDNNNSTPIDPVENPELGAVACTTDYSFALFWNDMGTWANPPRYNDDLGYQNAITDFTCPIPGSTSGGGPSTLSG